MSLSSFTHFYFKKSVLNQSSPSMTTINRCFLIIFVLLIASCDEQSTFIPKSYNKEIIAFLPAWKHGELEIEDIPFDKLTRLIYAFASPNPDGSLNTNRLFRLDDLVRKAHKKGVEVYVSIGGFDGGKNLPIIAINPDKRQKFIQELVDFAKLNNLNGIDIDWEYLSYTKERKKLKAQQQAFVVFLHHLHEALEPLGKSLSIDVYGSYWGGDFFLDEALKYIDQVHIMAYDYSGKWSEPMPHSSIQQVLGSKNDKYPTGLYYWLEKRKWPSEKLYLGLPFYGRDFNDENVKGKPFRAIIDEFPDAYQQDSVNNIFYNSHRTIQRKAEIVQEKNLPGVMIWEISQDTPDAEKSLLNVLHQKLNVN